MNPASVPPWGGPWHGLVQGGALPLSGGASIPYPQPPGAAYTQSGSTIFLTGTYGSTFRLRVPGVPAVVRSAEELAQDEMSGRQWRSEAILSGSRFQLHGKPMDGWIYIDPAGARWLVRCPQFNSQTLRSLNSPLNITVTLTRFGDLGCVPEVYSQTVTLPLDAVGYSGSVILPIDAIKSDGSAVIISCQGRSNDHFTCGFIELAISGLGAEAVLAASVVRNWSQVNVIDSPPSPALLWVDASNPSAGWMETEPANVLRSSRELVGEFSRELRRIIALWYDENDQLKDVVAKFVGAYTHNAPRPPLDAPGNILDFSTTSDVTGEYAIEVGGAVIDSLQISSNLSLQYATGVTEWDFSATVDGGMLSGSSSINNGVTNAPFPEIGYVINRLGSGLLEPIEDFSFVSLVPRNFSPLGAGTFFQAVIRPYWYSRQVVGFRSSTENGAPDPASRRWRFRPPVTPSGLAGGATIDITTPTGPTFYGSHDPYSGSAVWGQSTPVCYV